MSDEILKNDLKDKLLNNLMEAFELGYDTCARLISNESEKKTLLGIKQTISGEIKKAYLFAIENSIKKGSDNETK